ncbi:hypothetical protein EVAR_77720_1 [Eumeta japonica]|uniref:Uncharacterized protein n=1 Tax=Eumeta variegata TaxID=151549 RepID=A0A4C1TBN4_EUMVA|nr:hypothetical protein EVAR_77720_1 [Eumeta japonica]
MFSGYTPSLAGTPPTTLLKDALLKPHSGGSGKEAVTLEAVVGASVDGLVCGGGSVGTVSGNPAFGQHTCGSEDEAFTQADTGPTRYRCPARGRPIIVEWERDAALAGLSRSVTHRYVTERYTFS